jgi:hypothetical protein
MPTGSSRGCSEIAKAALLPTERPDGALGRPESPQGAEVIWHGLASVRPCFGAGSGAGGRIGD